jgi:hypothetical protein
MLQLQMQLSWHSTRGVWSANNKGSRLNNKACCVAHSSGSALLAKGHWLVVLLHDRVGQLKMSAQSCNGPTEEERSEL